MYKTERLYESFKRNPNFDVYYKEDVPERFHYSNSERIGPLVVVCKEGSYLKLKYNGLVYLGNHGFDNTLESMRAVFLGKNSTQLPILPFFISSLIRFYYVLDVVC